MSDVRIKTLKNGPYEVKGKVSLVDAAKNEFTVKDETIYLCRCGQSATKPFCDGTHNKIAFRSEEPAR
jgi:3-phenylpropionate/trans-cinnamate dioxygenase ferredoxin subunit